MVHLLVASEEASPTPRWRPLVITGKRDTPVTAPLTTNLAPSLSTVAHDLRAPLAAIATSSEILVSEFDNLDREEVRERVRGMHRRALWLQEMVENMLCASAMNEGRFSIRPYPLDLLDLTLEVQALVEPLLGQRKQRLAIDGRDALSTSVVADGRRLGQALMNLVLNASKFGPDNMTISVVLSGPRDGQIRCTVADRGPGLGGESATDLFEPFRQGRARSGLPTAGVGLGLAIVRSIVAAHGGSVGAQPRRGGGAEFWFEVPVAACTQEEEEPR